MNLCILETSLLLKCASLLYSNLKNALDLLINLCESPSVRAAVIGLPIGDDDMTS